MKKILFLMTFMLGFMISNAQTISCDGTYIMTEPNDGLKLKECCVNMNDDYVLFHLFDIEVVNPVYQKKHFTKNSIDGDVYYLDKEHMSYVFYGKSNGSMMCVVSVITIEGRYTFAKVFSDDLTTVDW